jgi:RNA polymerase sigma-70 factor, ECF subfamily
MDTSIVSGECADDGIHLLERYRSEGDRHSFDEFVVLHHDFVAGICRRILGRGDHAEDATQDAFIACMRAARSFSGEHSPRAWLGKIAVNVCRQRLRADRRRTRAVMATATTQTPAAQAGDEHDAIDDAMRRALATVPPHERLLLWLRFWDRLSCKEIGDVLSMPAKTIETRLRRTLTRLRRQAPAALLLLWTADDALADEGEQALRRALEADVQPTLLPALRRKAAACVIAATIVAALCTAVAASAYRGSGEDSTRPSSASIPPSTESAREASAPSSSIDPNVKVRWHYRAKQCSLSGDAMAMRRAGIDPDLPRQIVPAAAIRKLLDEGDSVHSGFGMSFGFRTSEPGWIIDISSSTIVKSADLPDKLQEIAASEIASETYGIALIARVDELHVALFRMGNLSILGSFSNNEQPMRNYGCPVRGLVTIGDTSDAPSADRLQSPVIRLGLDEAMVVQADVSPLPGEENFRRMVVFMSESGDIENGDGNVQVEPPPAIVQEPRVNS